MGAYKTPKNARRYGSTTMLTIPINPSQNGLSKEEGTNDENTFYQETKNQQDAINARLNGGTSEVLAALDDFCKSIGAKLDACGDKVVKFVETKTANKGSSDWLSEYSKQLTEASTALGAEYTRAEDARERRKKRAKKEYNDAKTLLDENYAKSKKALEAQKSLSEQAANINYSKLLKYLPEQLKAQGLYGVGKSSGTYLRAANDHGNRLNDISSRYTSDMREGASAYNNSLASLQSVKSASLDNADAIYEQAIMNADDRYGTTVSGLKSSLLNYLYNKEQEDNQRKLDNENTLKNTLKNTQDMYYNDALTRIVNFEAYATGFNTSAEAQSFLNGLKGNVREEQYSIIESRMSPIINELKTVEENNAAEQDRLGLKNGYDFGVRYNKNGGLSNWKDGDTFKVKIGDDVVKVDSAGAVDDANILSAASTLPVSRIFGYNGELYYKTPTGQIIAIKPGVKGYSAVYAAIYGKQGG